MSANVRLDEALEIALKLSPKERLQLVERLVSSVEDVMPSAAPETVEPPAEHWGKQLNALLDTLDTSDWEALEMDDPVEWLKQQREQESKQRLGDWGNIE